MNTPLINGIGNVNAAYSASLKANQAAPKCDTAPSFKALSLKTAARGISLAALLGMTALLNNGCQKTDPNINNLYNIDTCMCVGRDETRYSKDLINKIPAEDTYGRDAYIQWYDANVKTEILDPECCRDIVLVDPDWNKKCEEWIERYLSGEEMCEETDN